MALYTWRARLPTICKELILHNPEIGMAFCQNVVEEAYLQSLMGVARGNPALHTLPREGIGQAIT